jgi:rhomboid family GlyGly-CTERM serine protease
MAVEPRHPLQGARVHDTIPVLVAAALLVLGGPGHDVAWAELRPADGSAWREPWRLLLGHFVHHGRAHQLLNAGALALWFLLWRQGPGARLLELGVVALGTGVGIALVSERSYVVGLSGLLHGLFAASALLAWRDPAQRVTSAVVLVGLAGKIIWEQLSGPSPGTEQLVGLPVATEAHLCGAAAGVLYGAAASVVRNGGFGTNPHRSDPTR